MKLKSYEQLLKMGKEKVDETMAPLRAKRAKMQAMLEIAKMEETMATKEAKVYELCAKKDIDFQAIIGAQDEFALTERKKKQLEKIVKELFPEGK